VDDNICLIDIETTGLNPATDQILEICLLTNYDYLLVRVVHDRIMGHPKALAMNASLIADISSIDKETLHLPQRRKVHDQWRGIKADYGPNIVS